MLTIVRRVAGLGVLLTMLLSSLAVSGARAQDGTDLTLPSATVRLPPAKGVAFGVDLDWGNDNLANFSNRLGATPALSYIYLPYPLNDNAISTFERVSALMSSVGGGVMVALQPETALADLTDEDAAAFAELAAGAESNRLPLLVDFASQMNGSWFPYGMKPTEFTPAYQLFVATVREAAPATQFVWSPTYADGYPFITGEYLPEPGSEDFALLDTDQNGEITMGDDPYAPFYPGDDYVDWVGMTISHWGTTWPWYENEQPEPGKFLAQMHGEYNGLNGDATVLPDFYADYVEGHDKPFVLRTAALYLPNEPGDDELTIKQAWWNQVLSPETLDALPLMKAVIWAEWVRPESQSNDSIADWRITASRTVQQAFVADIPLESLVFAPHSLIGSDGS